MTKTFQAAALSLLLAAQAATSHAVNRPPQDGAVQNPAGGRGCQEVEPSEIVRGAYLQVWGRPGEPKAVAALEAKLVGGQLSVREMVRQLALSDEFESSFVAGRGVDEAVPLVHERLLARPPRPEEAAKWAEAARAGGFDAVVNAIVDGAEYADLFGETAVPGRPVRFRACGLAQRLERQDEFGEGRLMTTTVTVSKSGKVEGATRVGNPGTARQFCGKVALWLFDEQGNVFEVVGPPPQQLWCAKGGAAAAEEKWAAEVAPERLGRLKAAAIVHTGGGADPRDFTRDNMEKARKAKRVLR